MHGFTNPESQFAMTNKYFAVAHKICGSSASELLHFNFLAPRTLNLLLNFWKICAPLLKCIQYGLICFERFFKNQDIRLLRCRLAFSLTIFLDNPKRHEALTNKTLTTQKKLTLQRLSYFQHGSFKLHFLLSLTFLPFINLVLK